MIIPNNLELILSEKNLTIADCVRKSGLTRPTVKKLVEGEDSYISKMKTLADSIGVNLSMIYRDMGSVVIKSSSHDHSSTTNVGYQVNGDSEGAMKALRQRISDLEIIVNTKDKLLATQEELIRVLRGQN